MARPTIKYFAAALALSGVASCTVHKSDGQPSLTGPSTLGTAIVIQVSPDVLTQDGASQSLVTITANDNNGQPLRSLSLRAEIMVAGAITDFGSLSAKNVVTDASGKASIVYTAPSAPAIFVDGGTIVTIGVVPAGTNFGNETARTATIRLVAPGVIGAPPSGLIPSFALPPANVGDTAVFISTVTDPKGPSGNDASGQVTSFVWNFGDGGTGQGRSVTHVFNQPGTFPVTLTITDTVGRTAFVTQSMVIGQGQLPVASFLASPASPGVGQTINFNASASTASPGHVITVFAWNFGDGSLGSDALTTHAYEQAGSYTVTLKVTDDLGRKSALTSQVIAVGLNTPTAKFTFSPVAPAASQPINFNATQSTAVANRTIVGYSWDFGDNSPGSGVTTTHAYSTPGTYTVTLTVTDSASQQGFATQTITVQNDVPTAAFAVNPPSPSALTGTNAPVFFDGSGSTAVNGKTITAYSWTITFNSAPASLVSSSGVATSGSFQAPGTYIVTLIVTDSGGKTNSVSHTFTVTGT